MLRGVIRHSKAFTAASQEKVLRAAGVKQIYTDQLPHAIASLRKGEGLYVDGLRALGENQTRIVAELEKIHAKGGHVVDASTGRKTGLEGAVLMAEAVAALSNERRGHHDAARLHGLAGAKASAKAKRKGRMPKSEAVIIWRDIALQNYEALDKINADDAYPRKWTMPTLYKNLGKRGAYVGRRVTKQK